MSEEDSAGAAVVRLRQLLVSFWRDQSALTTIEYAMLLTTIAIGGLVAFGGLGQTVGGTVQNAADTVEEAAGNEGMECAG